MLDSSHAKGLESCHAVNSDWGVRVPKKSVALLPRLLYSDGGRGRLYIARRGRRVKPCGQRGDPRLD
jgi:hypothetical protein